MIYVADALIDEPLTKVRWLTDKTILAATVNGNLYAL